MRLLIAFLLGTVLGVAPVAVAQEVNPEDEIIPQVTLAEALSAATNLDPQYVQALYEIGNAQWVKRAAFTSFIVPAVSLQTTATEFSTEIFNVGIGAPSSRIVDARVNFSLNLMGSGSKIYNYKAATAGYESATAGETQQRFRAALDTEADYYDALAQEELTRVARQAVERAEEQMGVTRARVLAGAAVHSDSLQQLLELTRTQVDLIRQEALLRVSRYQLGRRVGSDGPVAPAPLDTLPAPVLPISQQEAIAEARGSSPTAVVARADARAAEANYTSTWTSYLPQLNLFGQYSAFDESFFPSGTTRSAIGLSLDVPLWNDGQREIEMARAQTAREVAKVQRNDTERALGRDVVEAYQAYESARAATDLASRGVVVARENLRVQEQRYRAGATTIIQLVDAQVALTEAQAGLVQSRFTTRLALAGLEAILGRRLFEVPQ